MSGPIETTAAIVVAGAITLAAFLVVPLPRQKPEQLPTPPAYERLAPDDNAPEHVIHVAPAIEPPPPPPEESDDHRIQALERSVYEIQRDQQQLKDEIRALVEEIKAK